MSSAFRLRELTCLLVLALAASPSVLAACKLNQVGEIAVDTAHNRLLTDGSIDGNPVRILFDTGSNLSFISESAAKRLGLSLSDVPGVRMWGVGGEAVVHRTTLKHLQMGSFYADNVPVLVLGSRMFASENAPAFVFGDDLFSHFDTEFDLAHGKVRLMRAEGCEPDQTPYWAQTFSMATLEGWDPRHPQIRSIVLVNGKRVSAIFDTGAPTSAITRDASIRAGVTPWDQGASPARQIHGMGEHAEQSWLGQFKSFAIGDEQLANVPLQISDLFREDRRVDLGSRIATSVEGLPSMLIGCDFFLSHRVLVLSKLHRMVFTYNGGPVFQTLHREGSPAEP